MPKVSIIVPVYNVEKYLSYCLDSILNQTFTDFEIICINDGSVDGSYVILEDYARKDSRIILYSQENKGLSAARNVGLSLAGGDYILFVDSDDAIEKQTLEISIKLLQEYNVDILQFGLCRHEGLKEVNSIFNIGNIEVRIINNALFSTIETGGASTLVWTKLYKSSFLKGSEFIPNIFYEDEAFSYSLFSKKPKVAVINTPFYLYTINPNSIMSTDFNLLKLKSYYKIIISIFELYQGKSLQEDYDFIKKYTLPAFVSQQYRKIQNLPLKKQLPFWIYFEKELKELKSKGLLESHNYQRYQHLRYSALIDYGAEFIWKKQESRYCKNNLLHRFMDIKELCFLLWISFFGLRKH